MSPKSEESEDPSVADCFISAEVEEKSEVVDFGEYPLKTNFPQVLSEDELDYEEMIGERQPENVQTAFFDEFEPNKQPKRRYSNGSKTETTETLKNLQKSENENDCTAKVRSPEEQHSHPLSEQDDLEEGELREDTPSSCSSSSSLSSSRPPPLPEQQQPGRKICPYFLRGMCTWGDNCRFLHTSLDERDSNSIFHPAPQYNRTFGCTQRKFEMWSRAEKGERPRGLYSDLSGMPSYSQRWSPPEKFLAESDWETNLKITGELIEKSASKKYECMIEKERLKQCTDKNHGPSEYGSDNEFFEESPYNRRHDDACRLLAEGTFDYSGSDYEQRRDQHKSRRYSSTNSHSQCPRTPRRELPYQREISSSPEVRLRNSSSRTRQRERNDKTYHTARRRSRSFSSPKAFPSRSRFYSTSDAADDEFRYHDQKNKYRCSDSSKAKYSKGHGSYHHGTRNRDTPLSKTETEHKRDDEWYDPWDRFQTSRSHRRSRSRSRSSSVSCSGREQLRVSARRKSSRIQKTVPPNMNRITPIRKNRSSKKRSLSTSSSSSNSSTSYSSYTSSGTGKRKLPYDKKIVSPSTPGYMVEKNRRSSITDGSESSRSSSESRNKPSSSRSRSVTSSSSRSTSSRSRSSASSVDSTSHSFSRQAEKPKTTLGAHCDDLRGSMTRKVVTRAKSSGRSKNSAVKTISPSTPPHDKSKNEVKSRKRSSPEPRMSDAKRRRCSERNLSSSTLKRPANSRKEELLKQLKAVQNAIKSKKMKT